MKTPALALAAAFATVIATGGAHVAHAEPAPTEPTTAVDFDPLHLLSGRYSLGITHALATHVAVRAEGTVYGAVAGVPDSRSGELAVSVPVYLGRAFQGPFVAFGGFARSTAYLGLGGLENGMPASLYAYRQEDLGVLAEVGWQWTFASGLTLAVVARTTRTLTHDQPGAVFGGPATVPELQLVARAGYAW